MGTESSVQVFRATEGLVDLPASSGDLSGTWNLDPSVSYDGCAFIPEQGVLESCFGRGTSSMMAV